MRRCSLRAGLPFYPSGVSSTALDFLVRRDDLRQTSLAAAPDACEIDLRPGEILLAIDRFGFSANNVTYAALGEAMHYWDFFPAPDGWGRIPVWGFADVARSAHDGIVEGERLFGYLPMSTHIVLRPDRVTEAGFADGAPHRAHLPAVYQRYSRVAADPRYDPEDEDQLALWRPLFMTSFGAADYLAENGLFGGRSVVISSASSKTALGTAFLLSRSRPAGCDVVGLTSPGNVEFCERLGYYDRVLPYADLERLSRESTAVFVDFAGDENLLDRARRHLGDSLRGSCIVGATHWEAREPAALGGPGTEFFFLPPWLEKRRRDWGPGEFATRYGEAWGAFLPSASSWLRIVRSAGPEAVGSVYRELLDGSVRPGVGHILSLAPAGP